MSISKFQGCSLALTAGTFGAAAAVAAKVAAALEPESLLHVAGKVGLYCLMAITNAGELRISQ